MALADPPDGGGGGAAARRRRATGASGSPTRGRALLRGEGAFLYREDAAAAPAGRSRTGPGKGADPPLDDDAAALLGALKALRLELARERGVPAYIVFSDRTLIDMARRRPRTEAEFAAINGVGAAKLERFAAPFLAAIAAAATGTAGETAARSQDYSLRRRRLAEVTARASAPIAAAGTSRRSRSCGGRRKARCGRGR